MPEGVLDRIVGSVKARLDAETAPEELADRAREAADRRRSEGLRSLRAALAAGGPAVIAECKRASPSAGLLRPDFDPVELARAYAGAGASALSVVTEPDFFQGRIEWLREVRRAVELPVLRKDFIFCERQLYETAAAGADAVLLIQRILEPDRLAALMAAARSLHLETLVELFVDESPAPAVASGAPIIGVNARDLATFTVDLDRVADMADSIPADRIRVAESGIGGRDDLLRLQEAGYDAFLIGEHLVRAADPEQALRELLGKEKGKRKKENEEARS
jgi:indole-3-glycerol phosphate synthase